MRDYFVIVAVMVMIGMPMLSPRASASAGSEDCISSLPPEQSADCGSKVTARVIYYECKLPIEVTDTSGKVHPSEISASGADFRSDQGLGLITSWISDSLADRVRLSNLSSEVQSLFASRYETARSRTCR